VAVFTKGHKSLAEVQLQVTPSHWISENLTPPAEFGVVEYLPVLRKDGMNDEYYSIEGGRVVAITAVTAARFLNKLDLANGGTNADVVYTANDIGIADDIAVSGATQSAVTGTATNTGARLANFPIGIVLQPVFNGTMKDRYTNFTLQPLIAVVNQGYWEYPVTFTSQSTLVRGGLVRSGLVGEIIDWVSGSDTVDQIVGRCWKIETIVAKSGLDKVQTLKNSGLSGTATSGKNAWLNVDHQSGGKATSKFRVVINVGL
jgi:hypothetical protein